MFLKEEPKSKSINIFEYAIIHRVVGSMNFENYSNWTESQDKMSKITADSGEENFATGGLTR